MKIINLKTVLLAIVVIIVFQYINSHNDKFDTTFMLSPNTTILAFGDSLTYGYGVPADKSYPSLLSKLLSVKVINAGKVAETTDKGLKRLPALLKRYKPNILIICDGSYDILKDKNLATTKENIAKMIELAKKKKIFVVLVGVPKLDILTLKTDKLYYDLSDKFNVPLEDEGLEEVLNNDSLKIDAIHPNAKGYKILSSKIATIVTDNYISQ